MFYISSILWHVALGTRIQHLGIDDVVYFEHNPGAVASAQSIGIKTYYWDNKRRPLRELSNFLEQAI